VTYWSLADIEVVDHDPQNGTARWQDLLTRIVGALRLGCGRGANAPEAKAARVIIEGPLDAVMCYGKVGWSGAI
jgi:hypothetical protein